MVTNLPGSGDRDPYQVVFFEVPDTETATLYFAIDSPGASGLTNGYPDENTADANPAPGVEDTTYTLIGGSGALSDPTSREADYRHLG